MEKEKKKSKLKIIIPIVVVVIVAIVGIVIFSNRTSKPVEPTELELTDEMIAEIKEQVNKKYTTVSGSVLVDLKLELSDYNKGMVVTKTNEKKEDNYTYIVYLKVKYIDNYNNNKQADMELRYTAEKDETQEKGYKINRAVY